MAPTIPEDDSRYLKNLLERRKSDAVRFRQQAQCFENEAEVLDSIISRLEAKTASSATKTNQQQQVSPSIDYLYAALKSDPKQLSELILAGLTGIESNKLSYLIRHLNSMAGGL